MTGAVKPETPEKPLHLEHPESFRDAPFVPPEAVQ